MPTPARKKSGRPAMTVKSPYGKKTPAKAAAGRSKAKHRTLAQPIAGTSERRGASLLPTRQEKEQARLRAREWARNTLGGRGKEASSPPPRPLRVDPSRVIVIDDYEDLEEREEEEEEEEVDPEWFVSGKDVARAASVETREEARTTFEFDILREQRSSRLNAESRKAPETSAFAGVRADESIEEEDVFYDAFEHLPRPRDASMEDVAVEDVSDDEDDEIRELRSAPRNRAPGEGEQWMEPLEPTGISFSTFVFRPDP